MKKTVNSLMGFEQYTVYYKDDKLHRDNDKPAVISWFSDKKLYYKKYYIEGKLDRKDKQPISKKWSFIKDKYVYKYLKEKK